MADLKDLRKQDEAKLRESLKKAEVELLEKKLKSTVSRDKNTSVFRKMKKEIARIKTIINEKEVLS